MCYTFLKIKSKSLKDSKQKPKVQSHKEQFRSWAVPERRSIIGSHIRKSTPGSLQLYMLDVSAEAFNACYPKNADCGRDTQACPDTKGHKTWFPVSKPVVMNMDEHVIFSCIHSQTFFKKLSQYEVLLVCGPLWLSKYYKAHICLHSNKLHRKWSNIKKYPNDHNPGTQQNNMSNCSFWVHQILKTAFVNRRMTQQLIAQLVTDPWPALTEVLRSALSWTSKHRIPRAC